MYLAEENEKIFLHLLGHLQVMVKGTTWESQLKTCIIINSVFISFLFHVAKARPSLTNHSLHLNKSPRMFSFNAATRF